MDVGLVRHCVFEFGHNGFFAVTDLHLFPSRSGFPERFPVFRRQCYGWPAALARIVAPGPYGIVANLEAFLVAAT